MLVARIRSVSGNDNRRWQARQPVAVATITRQANDGNPALILNISENGLLLESKESLRVGAVIEVDLPDFGETTAEVVWTQGSQKGCRFFSPIPKSVISAAVLRSPAKGQGTFQSVARSAQAPGRNVPRRKAHGPPMPLLIAILSLELILLAGLLYSVA